MSQRATLVVLGVLSALLTAGGAYLRYQLAGERAAFANALAAKDARVLSLLRELERARKLSSATAWSAVYASSSGNPHDTGSPVPPPPCSSSDEEAMAPSGQDDLDANELGEEPTPEEVAAAERFEVSQLELQMRDEPVDETWANDATARIAALSERSSVRFRLGAVACRSTVCRVELGHRDDRSRDDDLQTLVAVSPLESAIYVDPAREPGSPSIAYLARPGYQLSAFKARPPLLVGPQPSVQ